MVRDEIREISPGTWLGVVYLWKWKTIDFVLTQPRPAPAANPESSTQPA
jgi:hypothetical protein